MNCLKLLAKNSKAQLSLDQKDRSILHCSAMGGSLKSLHWLLEKGLKANQTECKELQLFVKIITSAMQTINGASLKEYWAAQHCLHEVIVAQCSRVYRI